MLQGWFEDVTLKAGVACFWKEVNSDSIQSIYTLIVCLLMLDYFIHAHFFSFSICPRMFSKSSGIPTSGGGTKIRWQRFASSSLCPRLGHDECAKAEPGARGRCTYSGRSQPSYHMIAISGTSDMSPPHHKSIDSKWSKHAALQGGARLKHRER